MTRFLLLSFTRDTYTVAACQHIVVILYGDIFHTTSVVIMESRYIISDKYSQQILSYFHEERHVVLVNEELTKASETLI